MVEAAFKWENHLIFEDGSTLSLARTGFNDDPARFVTKDTLAEGMSN